MKTPFSLPSLRNTCACLALGSALLLGCAHKLNVEIPQNFHGRVTILCTAASDDGSSQIHVDGTGTASGVTCPARQTDTIVTRANGGPVDSQVMWMTTGDGFVREIHFDVR